MPEHWIRLRGAWGWRDLASDAEIEQRVTLPIEWPSGQVSPVRLVRRFNGPPIAPGRESVSLRLEKVPGLLAIRLNHCTYDGPLDETLTIDLESFGPLAAKNVLILDVDPTRAARAGEAWGQIALVVDALGTDEEVRPHGTP
jgi:hypothetical protein